MERKKKNKNIEIRRYINYTLCMCAIVLISLFLSNMFKIYQNNKLGDSVLARTVGTIQLDDASNAIKELTTDDFIFISYVKSKDIRILEKKIKKIVINNELEKNFFYLDATDLMLENDYIDVINNKLNLNKKEAIEQLPALLYYHNGELKKVVSSTKDSIITSETLNQIIDMYELNGEIND